MIRKCPHCRFDLIAHTVDEVEIDHCHHCGGSFFEPEKLSKLFGPLLSPEIWKTDGMCQDLGLVGLKSPASGQPMRRYRIFFKHAVETDHCEQTGGIWLDQGEADRLCKMVRHASQANVSPLENVRPKFGVGDYILQVIFSIPLEMWHPRRRFPWATTLLIGTCIFVFVIELLSGVDDQSAIIKLFALHPDCLSTGKIWQLCTYIFLHGGILHIVGNLIILYVLGDNLEDAVGVKKYLIIFFAAGTAGGLTEVIFSTHDFVVGASGAVAGVAGAYLVLFPYVRLRIIIFFIPLFFSVQLLIGFWVAMNIINYFLGVPGIAWLCHIAGFVAGVSLAWPLRERPFAEIMEARAVKRTRKKPEMTPATAAKTLQNRTAMSSMMRNPKITAPPPPPPRKQK